MGKKEVGIKESKNHDENVLHTFSKWHEFVFYYRMRSEGKKPESIK